MASAFDLRPDMMCNSIPLAAEMWKTIPLRKSRFEPRIHRDAIKADTASVQCQIDLFGIDSLGKRYGNINPKVGNCVAVCAPDSLPDRLVLLAYLCEFAFVSDGMFFSSICSQFLKGDLIFIFGRPYGQRSRP